MGWDEFFSLMHGITLNTPLGQIISIRAEDDKEVLKAFSAEQKAIRAAWREPIDKKWREQEHERIKAMSVEEQEAKANELYHVLEKLFGGGTVVKSEVTKNG